MNRFAIAALLTLVACAAPEGEEQVDSTEGAASAGQTARGRAVADLHAFAFDALSKMGSVESARSIHPTFTAKCKAVASSRSTGPKDDRDGLILGTFCSTVEADFAKLEAPVNGPMDIGRSFAMGGLVTAFGAFVSGSQTAPAK